VTCLVLGLGGNAILFNAVHALLWRPLAFPDSDRVVSSFTLTPQGGQWTQMTPGFAALIRDRTEAFSEVGLARMMPDSVIVRPDEEGPELGVGVITLDYLRALSLEPLRGRFFTEEEVRAAAPVALVTEAAWRTDFGANPDVLGSTVPTMSNGRPGHLRIVGVVPGGATLPFLSKAKLLLPGPWLAPYDGTWDGNFSFKSVLRLKPGMDLARAKASVKAVVLDAERQWPADVRGFRLELEPLRAVLVPVNPKAVLLLYCAAALLLVLTGANVASLFLDRALGRAKDIALRLALGASLWHVVRATVMESLLVVGAGSVLAFLLEGLARPLVLGYLPDLEVLGPELLETSPTLLTFGVLTCLLVALAVALLPALQARRSDTAKTLAQGSARVTGASMPLRSSLVVAQVAVILVLLTVGSLVGRSFLQALRVDPGYDARSVVTFQAVLPVETRQWTPMAGELRDLVMGLPGTQGAAFTSESPLDELYSSVFKAGPGPWQPGDRNFTYKLVGSSYFQALRARVVRGRSFTDDEVTHFGDVSIVNERAARQLFGTEDAVGRVIRSGVSDSPTTVVGVVKDLRVAGLDREAPAVVYLPYAPVYRSLTFVVRTPMNAAAFSAALTARVKSTNAGVRLRGFESLQDSTERTIQRRLRAGVMVGSFALVGLVIGSVGLFGTLSSQVRHRRREMGIRLVLGATRQSIAQRVLGRGGRMVAIGAVLGLAGSLVAGRIVQMELFGVTPLDAPSFALALSLLCLATVLACLIPALRAARMEPAEILRCE
jgi:putative ABC transport system permease protein